MRLKVAAGGRKPQFEVLYEVNVYFAEFFEANVKRGFNMSVELTPVKKKRGGQQGNQNARKHGFYSASLTSDEIGRFWHIISQEHVSPETAILRIKLQSLVNHAPSHRVFSQVAPLIVRWSVKKYGLDRVGRAYLKAAVENALEQYYRSAFHQNARRPKVESQRNTFDLQSKCTQVLYELLRVKYRSFSE